MRSDQSRLRRWRARRRVLAAAAIAVRSLAAALGVLLIATCVRDTILQSTGHDTAATSSTGSGPGVTAAAPPYPCSGYVALTFDDGPERYTGQLAAAVSASGLHATFFLVGRHVAQYPQVARDLARDGFVLGDHTWSHRDLTGLSPAAIRRQITRGADAIRQATGQTPTLFRPPEGATDADVRAATDQAGMTEVIWTTDTNDWRAGATARQIADTALSVPPGGIILMHDFDSAATRSAVPLIADGLRARGLCSGRIVPSATPVPAWTGLSYNAAAAHW